MQKKHGAPHIGHYRCMIRCRLDEPLYKALKEYARTHGMGICATIRLSIYTLTSQAGVWRGATNMANALLDAKPEAGNAHSKSSTRVSGAKRS